MRKNCTSTFSSAALILSEVNNTIKLYKAVLIHIKESDFYKYFKSDLNSFVIVTPNSIGSILRVKCG